MPRNVRNFWIELRVDGAKKLVATGPKNKDGGFDMTIYIRNDGGVEMGMSVSGQVKKDGTLILRARKSRGGFGELEVETER